MKDSTEKRLYKSPAFQIYVNDFLGSAKVAMMDADQVGAYVLLLFLDWQEGGFAYDETHLAKWCRLSRLRFRKSWPALSLCFVEHDGRYWNPRLERERAKQAAWREKCRKGADITNAKRGAIADATAHSTADAVAPILSTQGVRIPLPLPLPVTASTTPAAHVEKFSNPVHKSAYEGFRRAASDPTAFDFAVAGVAEPLGGNGAGWPIVGQALADMAANSARFNVSTLRGFCRSLKTPPPARPSPPQRGGWQKPDPSPTNVHSAAPTPKSDLCPFCVAVHGVLPNGRPAELHESTCHLYDPSVRRAA